jgi:aminoglycoside phosphotransferase (APT) family kinase protein
VATDEAVARSILDALDLSGAQLSPLGLGLSSSAWRVSLAGRDLALRIALDRAGDAPSFRAEHVVMTRLAALGAATPVPVGGSWERAGWSLPAFSLTTLVAGRPLTAELDPGRIRQIALFLRTLHALPTVGFGPVLPDGGVSGVAGVSGVDGVGGRVDAADAPLRGFATERTAGLLAWMGGAPLWPFDESRLQAHPALLDRPELRTALETATVRIEAAERAGQAGLVHSDLHEENILDHDGHLAFLDFGEAFIGATDWEFASLAYFLGWPVADRVLEAYLDLGGAGAGRAATAGLAVSFGLYRWWQDRDRGVDEEVHDEAFIRDSLARMMSV